MDTRKYAIGELCSTISETYHGNDKEVILINTSDVLEGFVLNHTKVPNENIKGQFKKTFRKNDILFSEIRPANKRYAFIDFEDTEQYIASTKLMVLRPNLDLVLPRFLYAVLSSEDLLAELQHLAETRSGTFPQITFSTELAPTVVDVPDFETQEKIIKVLDVIEKKKRNNLAINKAIEEQAATLFNSWFVNFDAFDEPLVESPIGTMIPSSLNMVQIGNLPHELETGKRPKGGAVVDGIPSVGAENVKELGKFDFSSQKFIPFEFAETMKKGKINGYELLLYKDGGKPGTFIPHFSMFGEGFPYPEFYINEHVFKLDFFDKGYNEFSYFYMQTEYPYNWLASNGGKAAVPGINQHDVRSIWIYAPDNPKVKEFCEWVQPIFNTIFKNCLQNVKLQELQRTLLPKLMSGEIEMSDMNI